MAAVGAPIGQTDNECYTSSPLLHEGASETAVLLPGPAAPPPSNGGDRDITGQMDARVRSKFNPAQKMVPSDKAP
jgi:hypothetical protein